MKPSIQSQKSAVFSNIFQKYDGPAFAIRLWDGWSWSSSQNQRLACTLVVQNPGVLTSLLAAPNEITLGEAFIRGDLDVEGDLFSAFSISEHLFNRPRSLCRQTAEKLACKLYGMAQWCKHGAPHSLSRDRSSISYHYDHPVEFYEPWLGKTLAYSCAYFLTPQDPIDVAQEQKLELICQKLRLRPGDRFLDIGCGWGSLILHASGKHGVHAQGVTLSRKQAEEAKLRIEQARLKQSCAVDLRDYRALNGEWQPFDKIASVGMFEHVGLENLAQYFGIAHHLLRPGGAFLNHGIARSAVSPIRQSSFIDKYVFPDGHLVTLSQALSAAEAQGLEVRDVENLREHYDLTLQRWVEGLRQNADALLQLVSKTTYRIWLLYTAGSAAAFRRGDIAVYQVLFSRPEHGRSGLPLTRHDWYAPAAVNHNSHASLPAWQS